MRMVDPLVRGIYYMYLLPLGEPSKTIHDKEANEKIKETLKLYKTSLYSSVKDIRDILVIELKLRKGRL
jgi:hypothetical protein